jgi:hypothetical protein
MKRLIALTGTLLMAPAIAATMATTAAASSTVPTIATTGSHWSIKVTGGGCENVHFTTSTKFVADQFGDKGTWKEPAHSSLTMTWTAGDAKGAILKATFKTGSGTYKGEISEGALSNPIVMTPGTKAGC